MNNTGTKTMDSFALNDDLIEPMAHPNSSLVVEHHYNVMQQKKGAHCKAHYVSLKAVQV